MPQRQCNRRQQSMDLSLSGGRPQRPQCWGSFGWPVIVPLLTELLLSPGQSVSSFTLKQICVQLVLTSLENLEERCIQTGWQESRQKHTSNIVFHLLAGPYRSKLADRMFTCAPCHYIALYCLLCQSQYCSTEAETVPPYCGPTKAGVCN